MVYFSWLKWKLTRSKGNRKNISKLKNGESIDRNVYGYKDTTEFKKKFLCRRKGYRRLWM